MSKIQFSPQQLAFFDWCEHGTGSCVLEAVAGAGKSTSLIEAIKRIDGQVALLAYNKKIAEELKEKLKKNGVDWKKGEAGTVHSFGLRAFRKTFTSFDPKRDIVADKVSQIVDGLIDRDHEYFKYRSMIVKLVSMAKQRALGVIGSVEDTHIWLEMGDHYDIFAHEDNGNVPQLELVEIAKDVLKRSTRNTEIIDFDDMIYMPLIHRCRFWQYDVVMVDEAQDTNPARRAMVAAMLKKGGRGIFVGDRHQAIYGFTGSDNDSLEQIKRDFNAIDLPLTTTFRCPKAVVKFSQQWVSHIKAAETAPEGFVTSTHIDAFFKRNDLNGDSAVLCRNTKPLVELAFQCIRNKIPAKVEGREIGNNIKKMITRWKSIKNLGILKDKLDDYLGKQTTKLLASKNEVKLQQIEDMVETVKVIIDQCLKEGKHSVNDAIAFVDSLFADDIKGILTLCTIHRSKGLEWNTVFWLDRQGTCPSRWARQRWQQDQEANLCYVAATRAKQTLVEIIK